MELLRTEVEEFERLKRCGYRIVGRHSAVKVCHWTKSVLRGGKHCYKSWYGIRSHRCLQMTPSLQYCNMMCVFCWRHHTINRAISYGGEWDKPGEILEASIKEQRQLLSGFKGNSLVDRRLFQEALDPRHIAISLDGEPTLYPYLGELISLAHLRNMTTFLVTNGTNPRALEKLIEEGAQPTNLYISLYGPDRETHLKLCRPLISDSWERLLESLSIMNRFDRSRKVIRLTLVKGHNVTGIEEYAYLITTAEPDYVECKAYMHVGESQKRLPRESMPSMRDILEFSDKISRILGYRLVCRDDASRVAILANVNSPHYHRDEASADRSGLL